MVSKLGILSRPSAVAALAIVTASLIMGVAMSAAAGQTDETKDEKKETKASVASVAAAPPLVKKKSTEVSFEDVLVQGKYHFSDEAITTVEQDGVLDALLGVRTNFVDRMKNTAAKH